MSISAYGERLPLVPAAGRRMPPEALVSLPVVLLNVALIGRAWLANSITPSFSNHFATVNAANPPSKPLHTTAASCRAPWPARPQLGEDCQGAGGPADNVPARRIVRICATGEAKPFTNRPGPTKAKERAASPAPRHVKGWSHGYLQQRADTSICFVQLCVTVWVFAFPKPVTPIVVEHPSHPCVDTNVVGFPPAWRTSAPLAVSETRALVTVVHDSQFKCGANAGRVVVASRTGVGAPSCMRRSAPLTGASAAPLRRLMPRFNPMAILSVAVTSAIRRRLTRVFMVGVPGLVCVYFEPSTDVYVARTRNPPDFDHPILS